MNEQGSKDLLTRLADAGEDAIQRLGEMPGAGRAMDAITGMRDRVDELQRRVRGLDQLERRVATLEERVDKLAGEPGFPDPETPGGKRAAEAVQRSEEELG
jgi:plasmid stabilization system protein ParE